MGTSNFRLKVRVKTKRWPFTWGPFGGVKRVSLSCDEGEVKVSQSEGGDHDYSKAVCVEMYEGCCQLTTTVSYAGSARLKRQTIK